MKNRLEYFKLEPHKSYLISESIKREVENYLVSVADSELKYGDWLKIQAEFKKKAEVNPEYRLAYLKLSTESPDELTQLEMHVLEDQLRSRDSKK